MAAPGSLTRTPFFFFGRRPYREAELAAYLRREHRRGRPLAEIVSDPYIERCGGRTVLQAVLTHAPLIRAFRNNVVEAIVQSACEVRR